MNQFDPQMQVTIVDLTDGVPPEVLHFNSGVGTNAKLLVFEPDLKSPGMEDYPVYVVPRNYAERLLENAGGRTFRLISPDELIIRVSNGRGGKGYAKLIAWELNPETKTWSEKKPPKPEEKPTVGHAMIEVAAATEAPKPKEEQAEVITPPPMDEQSIGPMRQGRKQKR